MWPSSAPFTHLARTALAALSFCALLATSACTARSEPPAPAPRRAFYSWRTRFSLSPQEREALQRLRVERLYLRLFDVDVEPGEDRPRPRARVLLPAEHGLPPHVEIIPVVFLRERVFHHLGAEGPQGLARHVWNEVLRLSGAGGLSPRELQLDCDWSDSTRQPFFAFLESLERLATPAGVTLSATIRLHQVKYRERTGVPPVPRGMLMFYNMGRLGPEPGQRSIFNPQSASRYLARLPEYPLPLDVALPIWSWVLHVRGEHVHGLLQNTEEAALAANPSLAPRGTQGRYVATQATFLQGVLLREGDELQVESIDSATALEAARLLAPHLPAASPRTVSLFDLSERNLARHDVDSLERLFKTLR